MMKGLKKSTYIKGKCMKNLGLTIGILFMMSVQSVYACSFLTIGSYDAAYISKALRSSEFYAQLMNLGPDSRIESVKRNSDNVVTVTSSDKCEIVIKGTPVAAQVGEIACMNFKFSAETSCK
jgi:hypothetical protein